MKILKSIGIFLGIFLVYHLIGCAFFHVNENNVLQAPVWYPSLGLAISACAVILIGKAGTFKPPKNQPTHKSAVDIPAQSAPLFPTGNPKIDEVMAIVDTMDGHDFEQFCAELLNKCNYKNIHVTRSSGDQGVDIIAIKHGIRYAFQCKRYSSKLGNKPVQEVHTGKQFYSCQTGVVITNNYFTQGAEDAARRVGVQLWDRDTLIRKMGWGK